MMSISILDNIDNIIIISDEIKLRLSIEDKIDIDYRVSPTREVDIDTR